MAGDVRRLCVVCAQVYRDGITECPNDGAMLVIEAGGGTGGRLGHVLGNYRLMRVLGEGAVGTVYEGEHVGLRRKRAIKLLHPDATAEVVTRFFNEARAVNEIRHPNIVDIEDFVSNETGDHYLVMELLAGEDLRALLGREGKLAPARVSAIGEQLASALAAVHAVGIVHRDLKPENIFIHSAGGAEVCKLVDFGIAKFLSDGEGVTRAGVTLGTPAYMAPEQIVSDGQPEPRTDLYALGMVMYECLTGAPAFAAPTTAGVLRGHISEAVVPPSERRGEAVPPVLEAVVLKCLAKKPDARFANADALRAALTADVPVAVPVAPVAAVVAPAQPARRPQRSRAAQMVPAFLMMAAAALLHFAPSSHAAPAAQPPPVVVRVVAPPPPVTTPPPPPPVTAPPPAPAELSVQLESDPAGAELFVGAARTDLGAAPATATIPMSSDPIRIIARFPDGTELVQSIVPDRALTALRFVEPRAEKHPPPGHPPPATPTKAKKPDREGTIDPFR